MTEEQLAEQMPLPKWMEDVPLVFDWCRFNGRIYFASINYEESEKKGKAVFDLAYCATRALNDVFLITREYNKKSFCRWKKHSKW